MDSTHANWFFPTVCAGFGLFAVGSANLALGRSPSLVRAVATLGAVAVAAMLPAEMAIPVTTAEVAGLLALVLVPCLLLGSVRVTEALSSAVYHLHRADVRFGGVAALGLACAVGSLVVVECADEQAANATLCDLERSGGRGTSKGVTVATDRGTPIVLAESGPCSPDLDLGVEETKLLTRLRLGDQLIRRGVVDARSNCHGWVFAGGRYSVSEDQVALIMRENGYEEVPEPQPGNLIVYGSASGSRHTAIVRYVTEGQSVLVEGKWGRYGVFLHSADTSIYGIDYTFYASPRPGHLLAGLPDARTARARP